MTSIYVSKYEINSGSRLLCKYCPLALSIKKLFPKSIVTVQNEYVFIDVNMIRLPDEAIRFIMRFDDGLEVEPFTFQLDVNTQLLSQR